MARRPQLPLILLVLLVQAVTGIAEADGDGAPRVKTCKQTWLGRPGDGVAYQDTMRNDDYKLSVVIPAGLTGWGAAPSAPFHGFAIFFPGVTESCMGFKIKLRIDLGEGKAAARHLPGTPTKVGNRIGRKEERTGIVNGIALTNVIIDFSVRTRGEIDDGSVWLVTPTKDVAQNLPIFQKFVSQIRFEGEQAR